LAKCSAFFSLNHEDSFMIPKSFRHITNVWVETAQRISLEEIRLLAQDPLYLNRSDEPDWHSKHTYLRVGSMVMPDKSTNDFSRLFDMYAHPEHDGPLYVMKMPADTLNHKPSVFVDDLLARSDWSICPALNDYSPTVHDHYIDNSDHDQIWKDALQIRTEGDVWIFAREHSRVGNFIYCAETLAKQEAEAALEA